METTHLPQVPTEPEVSTVLASLARVRSIGTSDYMQVFRQLRHDGFKAEHLRLPVGSASLDGLLVGSVAVIVVPEPINTGEFNTHLRFCAQKFGTDSLVVFSTFPVDGLRSVKGRPVHYVQVSPTLHV